MEHRAVVVLTHYEGLSAADVGEILGIPPGTVYSRLHYALRALRSAINDPPVRSGRSRQWRVLDEHGD